MTARLFSYFADLCSLFECVLYQVAESFTFTRFNKVLAYLLKTLLYIRNRVIRE